MAKCLYCGCDVLGNARFCDSTCREMQEEEDNTTWIFYEPGKKPQVLNDNPLKVIAGVLEGGDEKDHVD